MANPLSYNRVDGLFVFSNPHDKATLVELAQCLEDWEDAKIIANACECSVYMVDNKRHSITFFGDGGLHERLCCSAPILREYHPSLKDANER